MTIAFIAGATGFTGRAIANLDSSTHGVDLRLHVRPASKSEGHLSNDPHIVKASFSNIAQLSQAITGSDVVVQLIGTTRKQFSENTNYDTVDFQTTEQLIKASLNSNIKHFILLSSAFAWSRFGPYLSWKHKIEQMLIKSGLPYTIVRAGPIAGNSRQNERPNLTMLSSLLGGLGNTPFSGFMHNLRPMDVDILAKLLLHFAASNPVNRPVEGHELWRLARAKDYYHWVSAAQIYNS